MSNLKNGIKAVILSLVILGSHIAQAGERVRVSENGWASCPAHSMSGCRRISDYTAKRDALQACKNHGGIPAGKPQVTQSDCHMNYSGYTTKECRSQAQVSCYLR